MKYDLVILHEDRSMLKGSSSELRTWVWLDHVNKESLRVAED